MKLEEVLIVQDNENEPNEQDEPERPRYVIRDAAYALSYEADFEWVIEQLISTGSVSLFYGEGGSKKTFSLLSMAVCVALGRPWLEYEVNPRTVLFIDEESGEKRLSLRLQAALKGEFGDEETAVKYVSLAGFKFDNKKDIEELQKMIEDTGAGLVIIDALSEVMDGDENSKKDTLPVFINL